MNMARKNLVPKDEKKKHPGGRPPKQREPKAASMVKALAECGVPQDRICKVLEESGFEPMCKDALERVYAKELAAGMAVGEAKLLQTAMQLAVKEKNVAMLCFLLKTRLGMRETNRVEMTSPDGSMSPKGVSMDLSGFTPEQLADMARAAFRGE